MNTFLRCPTCNNYLAPFINLVESIKIARLLDLKNSNEETKHYDMNNFIYSNENTLQIGDILDDLELNLLCCRTRMIGMTNFNVIFKNS